MCVVAEGFLRFSNKKFNFTIVDGFAGGGKYLYRNNEVDGSPLVILKAAQEASVLINHKRTELGCDSLNINTDFFFVEKEKDAAEYLKRTLDNEGHNPDKTHVRQGEFGNHLSQIIEFIKTKSGGKRGRAFFILDQYGFSKVLFDQITRIMTSLSSEVILTFAVDSLVAYLCDKSEVVLRKVGFTDSDIAQIRQPDNPDECRKLIQLTLSKHLRGTGASFYTPFCIYGDTSNWGYWLVHLSSHYRARDEMMKVHWDKGNDLVHYGGPGIDMFGYRSNQDERHTGQDLLGDEFRFDTVAVSRVLRSLRTEIPELIHQKGSVTYRNLLNEVFNHTPAKREIINKVLWEGVENKELLIPRRAVENIKDDDVIKVSPQTIIPFARSE